jgi:hypothetical protein
MTRKQNLAAALVTTASVALLAGAANAQNGTQGMGPGDARSGVAYCSSTQMSPAFNNCVMPAASAPGGGSFPGSFLVPGTNTSFAVHGIVFESVMHQFGPVQPQGGLIAVPSSAGAYQGPGVTATGLGLHALNGGTAFDSGPTRPNIETRTPTGYGELKTYIEFDFNESNAGANGTSQIAGNMGLVRMRQAYGTLGPWLMGQTKTLLDDVQTYPDLADAGLDFGMRTSTRVHKPQVRYTWLGGGGLTVAASAEDPTADAIQRAPKITSVEPQPPASCRSTTSCWPPNGTSPGAICGLPVPIMIRASTTSAARRQRRTQLRARAATLLVTSSA